MTTSDGQQERYEALTDEYAAGLIGAVGNHEVKAGILLAMHPDESYTAASLHDLYIEIQGEDDPPAWDLRPDTLMAYAKKSFLASGLVGIDEEGGVYKTADGLIYGDAVAGWSLIHSAQFPGSLINLFGKNRAAKDGTPGAPAQRFVILKELTENGMITFDAAASLTGAMKIGKHMEVLSRAGFVETIQNGSSVQIQELHFLTEEMASFNFRQGTQRELVRSILAVHGPGITYQKLYRLVSKHPSFDPSLGDIRAVTREAVEGIRSRIDVDTQMIKPTERSIAILRADRAEVATSMVEGFEAIKRGDMAAIEFFKTEGARYVAQPGIVRALISVARKSSPEERKIEPTQQEAMIMQLIRDGATSGPEILAALHEQGYDYTIDTVNRRLRSLKETGRVVAERVLGRRFTYSIGTEDNNQGLDETGVDGV